MMIVLIMPVILLMLFGFAISTEINDIPIAVVVDEYTPEVRLSLIHI